MNKQVGIMMVKALEDVLSQAELVKAGSLSQVTLCARQNQVAGNHVHAHAIVKIHLDACVSERELTEGVRKNSVVY